MYCVVRFTKKVEPWDLGPKCFSYRSKLLPKIYHHVHVGYNFKVLSVKMSIKVYGKY